MVIIATNKIIEVSTPNTMVPPKLEKAKIINPKNKINDVKIMLFPVWLIVSRIESLNEFLVNSFLNFARNTTTATDRLIETRRRRIQNLKCGRSPLPLFEI